MSDELSRRGFLQLLGAGAAIGLAACTRPPAERILPYDVQPEDAPGGAALSYATSYVEDGYAIGVLARSLGGRPVFLQGNPEHPASLGAIHARAQAQLLGLYDPQRARETTLAGGPAGFAAFARALAEAGQRRGLHIVAEPTASPSLLALLARAERELGARVWYWAPAEARGEARGLRLALGRPALPQLDLAAAQVICALDADLLASGPAALRHARAFADGRRRPAQAMNRLYAVEAMPSPTGFAADHRLRVRASRIGEVAGALLGELIALGRRPPGLPADAGALFEPLRAVPERAFVAALARDLAAAAPHAVVAAGPQQPPATHVAAHLINAALASAALRYSEPVLAGASEPSHELGGLVDDLRADRARSVLVLGVNCAYNAPGDLELAALLARSDAFYLGAYRDETAAACRWFTPAAHALESWGDARAADGTLSTLQPLIAPLFSGHTPAELLGVLLGDPPASGRDLVRATWPAELPFEATLQRGFAPGTQAPTIAAETDWAAALAALDDLTSEPAPLELSLRPSPQVGDGRAANIPWLQELPEPASKLTWDNAAYLSPRTAGRLGVGSGDVLELGAAGRRVRVAALIQPGHADDAITLDLGYGRAGAEAVARNLGASAYPLLGRDGRFTRAVTAGKTGHRHDLAITQEHWTLEGRAIALTTPRAAFLHSPPEPRRLPLSLLPELHRSGPQWAMAIDLGACTGCSACMVACQAENNVPVVGKQGVLRSREMHWLRIDRYFSGPLEDPRTVTQPMLCQHCEHAPCEYVCPVNATTHSPDGLNEMTYNRCVGTRFCSNNCPYKVRRFNYFQYHAGSGLHRLAMNPDVTVRDRGVMEKCTFCVQRLRRGEIRAREAGQPIAIADVQPACAEACPTRAISFGSLDDAASPVAQLGRDARAYHVLDELGTRPRVTYLMRLTNPNPELA